MSDLGGRASNGGARTGGPVPVPSGTPTGIRTPRDVMRDRHAREARRQEQQKAEEAQRLAEERRRSAERRAAAMTGGVPRLSQASSQYTPDPGLQHGFEGNIPVRSSSQRVSGADVLGEPVSRTQDYPAARTRAPSSSQQEPPRAAQQMSGGARRSQQSQSAPRQPSGQAAAGAAPGQPPQPPSGQREASSSFPHAFERWETLSSHWEGLTSYWLHKLEQNTDEIRNNIPNASTLNRQITDLSAAGANLFHAVVELQRLRASSERKFQRWFFETRADTERSSETQGQLERQLRLERSAREEAATKRADSEQAIADARREVGEMRRELMISKEEARRAWEELGRRNQEALDQAESLKAGRIAVVAGLQVVPYFGGPSRSGTGGSGRPGTREGPHQYGSGARTSSAGAAGLATPDDDQEYYREGPSPTNTDPFTEQQQPSQQRYESDPSSLAVGTYRPHAQGSGGAAQLAASASDSSRGQHQATASDPQRFYQQAPSDTFIHSPPSSSQGAGQAAPTQREEVHSEGSFAESLSEDTEYALDSEGNVRYDQRGRPIVFRRNAPQQGAEGASMGEGFLAGWSSHGGSDAPPEAPSVPLTSAEAMATYTPTSGPDYEGDGYGSWETRHHHPTRLSDVLEEEEERSSRRTGE